MLHSFSTRDIITRGRKVVGAGPSSQSDEGCLRGERLWIKTKPCYLVRGFTRCVKGRCEGMTTTGALKPGIMSNDRCMVGSVTIRSNLHVKLFDMKVRKSRLLTLAFLPKLGVIYHLLQKPSQAEMK